MNETLKPLALLHYNGDELPALVAEAKGHGNRWEHTGCFDTVRAAFMTAQSWERAGFKVQRISTKGVRNGFNFKGALVDSLKWYPLARFNLWHALAAYLKPGQFPAGHQGVWVFQVDTPLCGLTSNTLETVAAQAHAEHGADFVNLMCQHLSTCVFWCNWSFTQQAIMLLENYDNGTLPPLPGNYVSDETVLREYAKRVHTFPTGYYAVEKDSVHPAVGMVHYSRSTLGRFAETYRVNTPTV